MARTYCEIAIEVMLRTVEEAMHRVIDWWRVLPSPMEEAIEQFRMGQISGDDPSLTPLQSLHLLRGGPPPSWICGGAGGQRRGLVLFIAFPGMPCAAGVQLGGASSRQ